MMTKTLVTAAAVAALMAGAAQAGEKMKAAQANDRAVASDVAAQEMSPEARGSASTPSLHADPDMAAGVSAMSATGSGSDVSAVVSTDVVTNGPIADTPENRALYGQPLSHTGKRTKAVGN